MSEDLVSSLRDACLGPFDFAWLLERVADFGQEHPTWHGSEHKIDWKQGSPPAPIQLLVPEMILFHADKPHCLFFTDCAGFLRASVRALKQPHVVYHCMEQILKQRKESDIAWQAEMEQSYSRRCSRSSEVSEMHKTPSLRKPRATVVMKSPLTLRKNFWRLWVEEQHQQLPEGDVAERLAGTRGLGWPEGTRLLQASFWNSEKFITYDYDAIHSDVKGAVHTRLEDIINNHFERYTFLDSVRDRNKISAVPNLLAQRLAYYCNLELVSGKFTFYKDKRSQLWLVDATDLLLVATATRTSKGSDGTSSASEALPQKLFRYLSEEALQNLPVTEQDGPKHQRMFELMISYYQNMKQQYRVDRMLQKVQQELDTNVPVFEGTDLEALSKTFDLKGSRSSNSSSSPRRLQEVPKRRSRHGKHMAAIIARQRERQEEESSLGEQSAAPIEEMRSPKSSGFFTDGRRGSKTRPCPQLDRKAVKIEIVSTAIAMDLLEGAGTGACPEGSTTMDLLRPQICPPGQGLQMTRKNAVPCARVVTVPPGAATEAMVRLEEAVQAEKEAAFHEFQEQLYSREFRDASGKGSTEPNPTTDQPHGDHAATEMEGSGPGRAPKELVDMPLKHHICLADCLSGTCWKYTSS